MHYGAYPKTGVVVRSAPPTVFANVMVAKRGGRNGGIQR